MEKKYHSLHSNFIPSTTTIMDGSHTYFQVSLHYYKIITLSDNECIISFSDDECIPSFSNEPILHILNWSANCRSFEPVILPTETSQAVKERLLSFVKSLSTVVAFAYCLSRYAYFLTSFRIFLGINESFGHLVVLLVN